MTHHTLIFSTAYHPFVGGAEVAIKEITDRIDNIKFSMITPRYDRKLKKEEKVGNVYVYRIGFGNKFDKFLSPFLGAMKTISINKKDKIDTFWCMMVSFTSGAAYIADFFLRKKKHIVLTIQEGDSKEHIKRKRFGLIGLSWKMALKRSTRVTVISSYLQKLVRDYGYKGKIDLIPNGVNFDLFSSIPKKEHDGFCIITTSRLVYKNAIDEIIKSLQYLSEDVKLLVLGTGFLEKKLKKLAEEMNVSNRVEFLGHIKHKDLPRYFSISDVFVRPSRSEGMGISFLEAMAAGIPVIATNVGGISDFLYDMETGLVCNVDDPESISDNIKKLKSNFNLKNDIIYKAKKLVKEKYGWKKISKNMEKILL